MSTDPMFALVAEHQRALLAEADSYRLAAAARMTRPDRRRRSATEPMMTAVLRPGCRPGGCAGLCTGDGLAVVHQAYRGRLLGRARAVLGDAGLAEDVVQETFVRAWRACATFDPDGPPMLSWLGVILRNVALDVARARGRRPGLLRSVPGEGAASPTRPTDVDLMLLRTALRDALAGLASEHRTAVVETILRDRPYAEVAAELGVPVGTLRSRAHHALRRLRRLIEAADQGIPELHKGPTGA